MRIKAAAAVAEAEAEAGGRGRSTGQAAAAAAVGRQLSVKWRHVYFGSQSEATKNMAQTKTLSKFSNGTRKRLSRAAKYTITTTTTMAKEIQEEEEDKMIFVCIHISILFL